MTAQSEKDIWNMTMDVTMGQDCPDRVSLDGLAWHVSLDMTGWPGHDSKDQASRIGVLGIRMLEQDNWDRTVVAG
jgi:hypothetical protein